MALPILKLHKITYADSTTNVTKEFFFLANPATYASIDTQLGVTEATQNEIAVEGDGTSVSSLLGSGYFVRLVIYFKQGTTNRTARILCPINRVNTFRKYIAGKSYKSGTVKKAGQPRKTTFY